MNEHTKSAEQPKVAPSPRAKDGTDVAAAKDEEQKEALQKYENKFAEIDSALNVINSYSENGNNANVVPAIVELLKQTEALRPEMVKNEAAQKLGELNDLGIKLKGVVAFINDYKAVDAALDDHDIKEKPEYDTWKTEFDGISILNYSLNLGQKLKALKEKAQSKPQQVAGQQQEGAQSAAPEAQTELPKLNFENQNCSLLVDSKIWGSLNALPGRARMRVYEELKKVWEARNKTDTSGKDETTMQGLVKVNSYINGFISLNDRYRAFHNNLMRIDDPKFAEEINRTLSANFDCKEGVILDFKALPDTGDLRDYFKSALTILKDVEKKTVEKMGTWGSWLANIENKFSASKGVADLVKTVVMWIFGKEAFETLQSMFPGTFGKPESEKVKETIKDLDDKISSLPETDAKKKVFSERLKKIKEGKIGDAEGEYKNEKARTDDLADLQSKVDTHLNEPDAKATEVLNRKIGEGDTLIKTMKELKIDPKQKKEKESEFNNLQGQVSLLETEWNTTKASTDAQAKNTAIDASLNKLKQHHDKLKPLTASEAAAAETEEEIPDREHYEKAMSEFFQNVMDQLEDEEKDRTNLRKMDMEEFLSLDEEKIEDKILEETGLYGMASVNAFGGDDDVRQLQSLQKVLKKFGESAEGKALRDNKGENVEDYFVRMLSTENAVSKFYDIITNDDYKFDKEKIKKIYDDNDLSYKKKTAKQKS